MNDLPDELWMDIFTHLPLGRHKVVLRLTCKRWSRLFNEPRAHGSDAVEASYASSEVVVVPNEGLHHAFTQCVPLRWHYGQYRGEAWIQRNLQGVQINEAISAAHLAFARYTLTQSHR